MMIFKEFMREKQTLLANTQRKAENEMTLILILPKASRRVFFLRRAFNYWQQGRRTNMLKMNYQS